MTTLSHPSPTDEARTRFHSELVGAFDEIAPELLRVATGLSAPGIDPADILQSTFLRATELAHRFDPRQRQLPWLIAIAKCIAHEERRRVQRPETGQHMVDPPSPLESAERAELLDAVATAIDELPAAYRRTVAQHLLAGLTLREISEAEGQPIGTVKSRLHRGLDRLRRALPPTFAAAVLTQLNAPLRAARDIVFGAPASTRTTTRFAISRRGSARGWGTAGLVGVVMILVITVSGLFERTDARTPFTPDIDQSAAAATPTAAESPRRIASIPARAPWRVTGQLTDWQLAPLRERVRMRAYRTSSAPSLHVREVMRMNERATRLVPSMRRTLADSKSWLGAESDLSGRFDLQIDGDAVGAWLTIDHDYLALIAPIPSTPLDSNETDLESLPCYLGSVVEGQNPALAGGIVELRVDENSMHPSLAIAASIALSNGRMLARADADGTFRFVGVWPEVELSVRAFANGRGFGATVPPLRPEESRHVALPQLSLGTVKVRVADAAGRPLSEVEISLFSATDVAQADAICGTTDHRGVSLFQGVFPEQSRVLAQHPAFVPTGVRHTVHAGVQQLDIRLESGETVQGTVLASDGTTLPDARVELLRAMLPPGPNATEDIHAHALSALPMPSDLRQLPMIVVGRGSTDRRGEFQIQSRNKDVVVRIEPPASRHDLGAIECDPTALGSPVELPTIPTIVARLAPSDRQPPLSRIGVTWRYDETDPGIAATTICPVGADGALALGRAPTRATAVEFETSSGTSTILSIPDSTGSTIDLGEIHLVSPGSSRGRILDERGDAVAGAHVTWTSMMATSPLPMGSATSGPDGYYELQVADDTALIVRGRVGNRIGSTGCRPNSRKQTIPDIVLEPGGRVLGSCDIDSAIVLMNIRSRSTRLALPSPDGSFGFDCVEPGRSMLIEQGRDRQPRGMRKLNLAAGEQVTVSFEPSREPTSRQSVVVKVLGLTPNITHPMLVFGSVAQDTMPSVVGIKRGIATVDWPAEPVRMFVTNAEGEMLGHAHVFEQPPATGEMAIRVQAGELHGRFLGGSDGRLVCTYDLEPVTSVAPEAQWAAVDADGTFRFRGLTIGHTYRIAVFGKRVGSVIVRAQRSTTVEIEPEPPGQIQLTPRSGEDNHRTRSVRLCFDGIELPAIYDAALRHHSSILSQLPSGDYSVSAIDEPTRSIRVTVAAGARSACCLDPTTPREGEVGITQR